MQNHVEMLLAGMIRDRNILERVFASGFTYKDLPHPMSDIVFKAGRFFIDNGIDPSPEKLRLFINENVENPVRAIALARQSSTLESVDLDTLDYGYKSLVKIKEDTNFLSRVRDAVVASSSGAEGLEEAKRIISEIQSAKSSDIDLDIFNALTPEGFQRVQEARREIAEDRIPSLKFGEGRMKFLHEIFPRGLMQDTMTIISAGTGVGKSILSANIVAEGVRPYNDKVTLYIITENREVEAVSRIHSILLGKQYDTMYDMEREEDLKASISQHSGSLFVWKVIPNILNVEHIQLALDHIKKEHGKTVEVLCVDSPEHMVSIRPLREFYLNQANIIYELKNLMERNHLIMIITYQMTAEGVKNASTIAEALAGTKERSRTADNVLVLTVKDGDRQLGIRRLTVSKLRDGNNDGMERKLFLAPDLSFSNYSQQANAQEVLEILRAKMEANDGSYLDESQG